MSKSTVLKTWCYRYLQKSSRLRIENSENKLKDLLRWVFRYMRVRIVVLGKRTIIIWKIYTILL